MDTSQSKLTEYHKDIFIFFPAIPKKHVFYHSLYFGTMKSSIVTALTGCKEPRFEYTFQYILMSIDVYIGRGVVWTARATWRVKKTSSL